MLKELTKAQRKAARSLIDIALERECAKLIDEISSLAHKPLDNVEKPNHARYIELYKAIDTFDKHLADRYDGITGGRYLDTVSLLLADGCLFDEDLEGSTNEWLEPVSDEQYYDVNIRSVQ